MLADANRPYICDWPNWAYGRFSLGWAVVVIYVDGGDDSEDGVDFFLLSVRYHIPTSGHIISVHHQK